MATTRSLKHNSDQGGKNSKSYKAWITLIYGSEDSDTSNNSSLSSDNEADILLARNRQQWQYAHRKLEDSNSVEYISPVNCFGLLERARAAIFLSINELWNSSNIIGLKASILDPQALKLLPFATTQKWKGTEAQVRAELLLFENQMNILSSAEIEKSIVTISKDPQDSLSAEL
ncbi:24007_t:CDS:2 [Racocetra persica]|uniref:24007_t:CDS:1 n=1 Tax=Racocetra persica TaxID=160502 RepID=A0ACA9LHW6_9GLOM|nr:24007_t:CDS:2 [Racocetra persica]